MLGRDRLACWLLHVQFLHVGGVEDQIVSGRYVYTVDLLRMSACIPLPMAQPTPPGLDQVHSPLVLQRWRQSLQNYPDTTFAKYLLEGIAGGFRIGFDYQQHKCRSAKRNMLSATQHQSVIDEYLAKECSVGRIIGPIAKGSLPLQINRFGVIPKPHRPGKWRLIVDLSSPGASVNDGVSTDLCSLTYASIDDAVALIIRQGRGTQLTKVDLENAYRMVPVHLDDRLLLGMEWKGQWYVDTALPFGLRSAPKIFSALADGLIWIRFNQGVQSAIHYLDDYFLLGSPDTSECANALQLTLSICSQLGVPVSTSKVEGPLTTITFLGIVLDTIKSEVRLPEDKLSRLKVRLQRWRYKKSCTKRELLSLIGHLQHACKVVRPGRTFLRRMIELSTTGKQLHHHIRLTAAFG